MKLATVVVCYYPKEDLLENINSYRSLSDILYVWDNTPSGSDIVRAIPEETPFRVLNSGGENHGLSYAYNRAIELAQKEGCTHIMTMDQDSCFEHFDQFVKAVASCEDRVYGVFCPPINNPELEHDTEVPHAAQSGCVFDLRMVDEIGGFREDFFIGMVDVEMQLKAARAGYKMLCVAGCNLVHHVGSGREVKFLGHKVVVSDYNPLRHYYDSRNRILMWHEFPDDYTFGGKLKHYLNRLKTMAKIVLFEDKKWPKTKAIIQGTYFGMIDRAKPFEGKK